MPGMTGMNSRLSANNPTVVSAFHSALFHQGLVVLGLFALVVLAWSLMRAATLRAVLSGESPVQARAGSGDLEPLVRRILRVGIALFWILDGLLQAQSSMPLGLISQVVQPAAATSPPWLQHLVNAGGTIWNDHPITAATATVWIQLGIGLLLLFAPRGVWSRLAGAASVCWGLVVWVFGEAFGGIFGTGSSWLFGLPGAVLFYCVAGVLVALPERVFADRRLGRWMCSVMGLYFLGMAALQAWPGRGFWQAGSHNDLATMVRAMAGASQPHTISSFLRSFGSFAASNAFAVNLAVVIMLALVGAGLLVAQPRVTRSAIVLGAVLCLADWVLVQDLGVLGGVGTDPNSMLPTLLLVVAGYAQLVRPAAPVEAEAPAFSAGVGAVTPPSEPEPEPGAEPGLVPGLGGRIRQAPTYFIRVFAGLASVAVIGLGAVPMAVASVNPNADPIVSQAIDGTPNAVQAAAPRFSLENQYGRPVTLSSLRSKVIVLTFLDPVCTVDCPIIAQEMRQADHMLGATSRQVVFVAVVANPIFRSLSATQTFDRVEGMASLRNWLFLTGSVHELRQTWRAFGEEVAVVPAGSMVAHNDIVYVIDGRGETRFILNSDPGPGSAASKSSFATVIVSCVDRVLGSR
jgi:cytochrome oxidase Cu insertion factor (SCO1/SenC/PrrC family)